MKQWINLLCLLCVATVCAGNNDHAERLDTLNRNIVNIQQRLNNSTAQKEKLQTSLATVETREASLRQHIQQTEQQLSAQQGQLAALKNKSSQLLYDRDHYRQQLLAQIHAAYVFDHQPLSKILLTPGQLQKTNQVLMYYHYITEAQAKSVRDLENSIQDYHQNQNAIQAHYNELLALKNTQLHNQENLQKTLTDRHTLLANITQNIKSNQEKLSQLLHDRSTLQSTLFALNQASNAESEKFISHTTFKKLEGKLPWPLQGKIERLFGTPINQSELKWDGVLIDTAEGSPVRSVADGKVIFSKWLAGYGFLMIINHGSGYMSLYGRNQSLEKGVGDTVSAGEIIATSGQSGGFDKSGLYFEIRHDAQALNPSTWCR